MLDILDDDVVFGHGPLGMAGSLVRACLEDALIDIDGPPMQRVASPGGSSVEETPVARVQPVASTKSDAQGETMKLGIGGAVYAKALREVSAASRDACRIQEPHPEPGPSDKVPAASRLKREAWPAPNQNDVDSRLQPPRAPPPQGRDPRRYVRPTAVNAAIVASAISPSPGAASSNQPPRPSLPARSEQGRIEVPMHAIGETRRFSDNLIADIPVSMSSFGSLSQFKGSHVAPKESSPKALGTGEVLRGALEVLAPSSRLPVITNASNDIRRNSMDGAHDMTLPPLRGVGSRSENAKNSVAQDADFLPPIASARRVREVPLYLRMQRHYEEQQQKILTDAQDRRRAEVAGLLVSATPAPQAKKLRRPPLFVKKLKGPRRKRIQKKRHVNSEGEHETNQAPHDEPGDSVLVVSSASAPSSQPQGHEEREGRTEIKKPSRPKQVSKEKDPRKKRHAKKKASQQKEVDRNDDKSCGIEDELQAGIPQVQDNVTETDDIPSLVDGANSIPQVSPGQAEANVRDIDDTPSPVDAVDSTSQVFVGQVQDIVTDIDDTPSPVDAVDSTSQVLVGQVQDIVTDVDDIPSPVDAADRTCELQALPSEEEMEQVVQETDEKVDVTVQLFVEEVVDESTGKLEEQEELAKEFEGEISSVEEASQNKLST